MSRSPRDDDDRDGERANKPEIERRTAAESTDKPGGLSFVGKAKKFTVEREKVCPFLLRTFVRDGSFHRIEGFTELPPKEDEIDFHTWKDCTLRELASLIAETRPSAATRQAKISFKLLYKDTQRGRYSFTDIGNVLNARTTPDDNKTLSDVKLQIGDLMSIAIFSSGDRPAEGPGDRGMGTGPRGPRDMIQFGERDRDTRPVGGGRMAGRLGGGPGTFGNGRPRFDGDTQGFHPYRAGPGGVGPGPRGSFDDKGPRGGAGRDMGREQQPHPWDVRPRDFRGGFGGGGAGFRSDR